MSEHRVRFAWRGMRVAIWGPGSQAGFHDHIEVVEPDFPEEWAFVYAECACGVKFRDADEAWEHLDEVADDDYDTAADDDAEDSEGPEPESVDRLVLVDMFDGPEFGTGSGPVNRVVEIEPEAELWSLWTAWQVLELVQNAMEDTDVEYNAVVYRASPDETVVGEDGRLSPGTTVIRLPEMAVVADWVPAGRPVRVTNSERAPYKIEDASDDRSDFGNQR